MMTIFKKLRELQTKLKAPKSQRNKFGNYNYRSAEDILEAVKPLLAEFALTQVIDDEIVEIEGRYYVKATVTIYDDEGISIKTQAYAREADSKKGMDEAQVTGATSSYARKYALNGMYAIDDTKDNDTDEYVKVQTGAEAKKTSATRKKADKDLMLNKIVDLAKKKEMDFEIINLWIKQEFNKERSTDLAAEEVEKLWAYVNEFK